MFIVYVMYACMYMCRYMCMCVYVYVCVCVYIYMNVYVCIVYVYVCIFVYVCIYFRTLERGPYRIQWHSIGYSHLKGCSRFLLEFFLETIQIQTIKAEVFKISTL